MVPILPNKPWEYAGVDFVGPLPQGMPTSLFLSIISQNGLRCASAQVAAAKFVSARCPNLPHL